MAVGWLGKLREYVPTGRRRTQVEPMGPPAPAPDPNRDRIDAKPRVSWLQAMGDSIRSAVPLSMLITGTMLTACSELIGMWALLGYMLLVATPIVIWLQRIEYRLQQLLEASKSRRDRP